MKKHNLKTVGMLLLALVLCLGLFPLHTVRADGKTRVFKDDAGRSIELPETLKKIAPSGPLAQLVLITAAPDKLCGIAKKPSKAQQAILPENVLKLPEFGAFYGKNANYNLEAVLKAGPDVIIDIGEKKKSIKDDLDKLQEQTGIPTLFIEARLENLDKTYARLEELFGASEHLSALQEDIKATLKRAEDARKALEKDKKDPVKVYLAMGERGTNTDAKESFQSQVLPLVPLDNVADVEPQSKGGASEVSMEQILLWQPEWILVDNLRLLEDMKKDKSWDDVDAFKNGHILLVPNVPYGFLSNPPSVNRLFGLDYLGASFYPELYPFTPEERVKELFKLYFDAELTDEELDKILHPSLEDLEEEEKQPEATKKSA